MSNVYACRDPPLQQLKRTLTRRFCDCQEGRGDRLMLIILESTKREYCKEFRAVVTQCQTNRAGGHDR